MNVVHRECVRTEFEQTLWASVCNDVTGSDLIV